MGLGVIALNSHRGGNVNFGGFLWGFSLAAGGAASCTRRGVAEPFGRVCLCRPALVTICFYTFAVSSPRAECKCRCLQKQVGDPLVRVAFPAGVGCSSSLLWFAETFPSPTCDEGGTRAAAAASLPAPRSNLHLPRASGNAPFFGTPLGDCSWMANCNTLNSRDVNYDFFLPLLSA